PVSIEVQSTDGAPPCDGILPDTGVNGATSPLDVARQPYVHGQETGHDGDYRASFPIKDPNRFSTSPGFWKPCFSNASMVPRAAGRAIEAMQASQPAAISTSGGKLASLTRRLVFAIAHLSNEAIRVASASTKPS